MSAGRLPQQCTIADLETADDIVALNESEHRPLMLERFPKWQDRAHYWDIGDVEFVEPTVALAAIAVQIEALLSRLAGDADH
jgi:protein-tyrosine phosphatase